MEKEIKKIEQNIYELIENLRGEEGDFGRDIVFVAELKDRLEDLFEEYK